MKTIRSVRFIAAPALLIGLLAACTSGAGQAAAPPTVPSTGPDATDDTVGFKVYFLMHDPRAFEFLVPVQRTVPQTENLAAVAIRELLAGPTADERSGVYPGRRGQLASLSTAVPPNTKLLGVDIQGGIATVNLSGEFGTSGDDIGSHVLRQAQIVYTLTQFPTVVGVAFRLDGKPIVVVEGHEATSSFGPATRNLYFDQRLAVFVDEPAWGDPVGDEVLVAGETYLDAALRIALVDGITDTILTERTVHASCDPCIAPDAWGPFEARLSMPAGPHPADLRLRIWQPPYKEGGPPIVVDYPLGSSHGSQAQESTTAITSFDCHPESLPATVDLAQIADVRVGSHGAGPSGYDRIVFTFQGQGIPNVRLEAARPPFTRDPSDLPLPVRGTSFLVLVLSGATRVTPDGTITYGGRTDFTPDFPALTEFKEAGDFETVSQWVAGLTGPSCHRMFVLDGPTRLVIDMQHPQG